MDCIKPPVCQSVTHGYSGLYSSSSEDDDQANTGGFDVARIESTVLPCLPVQCHDLILEIAKQITGTTTAPLLGIDTITASLAPLIKGLLTSFSVVVMLPWLALEDVRSLLSAPDKKLRNPELRCRLEELCPEVYHALEDTYRKCNLAFPMVAGFIAGICNMVEYWAKCSIEPPHFHAIPRSYNPEATGMALHLTPGRLQGRVARRYVSDGAGDVVVCNKDFRTARGRTGGLFRYWYISVVFSIVNYVHIHTLQTTVLIPSFFCVEHGMCLGTGVIPVAEGRRDPFWGVYLHCPNPPNKFFYDFACGLCEFALNREPHYWRNVR
jgi:hypothetical protein